MKYILINILMLYVFTTHAQEQTNVLTSEEKDCHETHIGHGLHTDFAPVGLMGTHTHPAGEWMFSYRFMNMNMDGMRNGANSLETSDVLEEYLISPLNMDMQMHMFGVMYALNDRLTLMGMGGFVSNTMDHEMKNGNLFTTSSNNISDIKLSALYQVVGHSNQSAIIGLGISIPTGNINEVDITPMSEPASMQLPYPMQTGTGTWDLLPSFSFTKHFSRLALGLKLEGRVHVGENERSYSFGNNWSASPWVAYNLADWISVSYRLDYQRVSSLSGADPMFEMALQNNMVPTIDGENMGGQIMNSNMGVKLYLPGSGLQIGMEYLLPIVQDLNGTQLETKQSLVLSVFYSH